MNDDNETGLECLLKQFYYYNLCLRQSRTNIPSSKYTFASVSVYECGVGFGLEFADAAIGILRRSSTNAGRFYSGSVI